MLKLRALALDWAFQENWGFQENWSVTFVILLHRAPRVVSVSPTSTGTEPLRYLVQAVLYRKQSSHHLHSYLPGLSKEGLEESVKQPLLALAGGPGSGGEVVWTFHALSHLGFTWPPKC